MKSLLLPDGAILNLEQVISFTRAANVITFTTNGGGAYTYTATNDDDAIFAFFRVQEFMVSPFGFFIVGNNPT